MNLSKMNRHRFSPGVTLGDVEYPPGGAFGPRVQQDYQLVVLLSGEVRIELGDRALMLLEGQAVVMLPGCTERYRFAAERPSRHTWCAVSPELVPPSLQERLEPLSQPFPLHPRTQALMEYGLSFPASALPEAHAVLDNLGLLVLRSLVFENLSGPSDRREPEAVGKARGFMEAHLGEPLTLNIIAEAVHLTPQHLGRLFHQHLGLTPMRYLWKLRTVRGAELLRVTGLSVGAIAEQTGFQSPFHFSRLVRQMYGYPPRALRQVWWGGEGRSRD